MQPCMKTVMYVCIESICRPPYGEPSTTTVPDNFFVVESNIQFQGKEESEVQEFGNYQFLIWAANEVGSPRHARKSQFSPIPTSQTTFLARGTLRPIEWLRYLHWSGRDIYSRRQRHSMLNRKGRRLVMHSL